MVRFPGKNKKIPKESDNQSTESKKPAQTAEIVSTQQQALVEEIPAPLAQHIPKLLNKIQAELDQEDVLFNLIEQIQFAPLMNSADSALEMPTMVFLVNEGEVRPYPATQLNDREIVIDFGARYENMLKKVYGDDVKENPKRAMLRKKFFVGVDAHKLILPREFFIHPALANKEIIESLPKYIHLRVFKMYMGEPFVRNFFTNDIVNKKEKWELLVEQNIAERIITEEDIIEGFTEAKNKTGESINNEDGVPLYQLEKRTVQWNYRIKKEFLVSADKPVYDINSFDFVKSEFFEQEFSKMIVVGIRALYEEFDRKGVSIGLYMLGEAIVFLIAMALLLYFMPNIISTSKAANGLYITLQTIGTKIWSLAHIIFRR